MFFSLTAMPLIRGSSKKWVIGWLGVIRVFIDKLGSRDREES